MVCAAGSMPGDLHKLWRTRDPKGYHVEYGYSCMGYEVAGGLGVRLACPDRDVFVMVGDGSYLMMATELVTAVQEGIKIITVLVQNHGFASIGSLSESLGSQRFGTSYRYRNPDSGRLDGDKLPVDLAANAASLGLEVIKSSTAGEFADAIKAAKAARSQRGDLRRDRSADRRAGLGVLVGRAGQRDLDARLHPASAQDLRRAQGHSKAVPVKEDMCHPRSRSAPHRTRGESGSPAILSRCRRSGSFARWSKPVTSAIELGPYGYLPTDPAELQEQLDEHGLGVLAGTVFEHLHRPDSWDASGSRSPTSRR